MTRVVDEQSDDTDQSDHDDHRLSVSPYKDSGYRYEERLNDDVTCH